MDFFQHQDVARRKTKILVVYFVLAVLGMLSALYLCTVIAFGMYARHQEVDQINFWQPELLGIVSVATLMIVIGGSLFKIVEMSRGGDSVATMLGGRRINPNTSDPEERRLLNVVEEMALAAGIAVPPVYLLQGEDSINAFAAGYTPDDAVIGVNRGTLKYLTRDELQGVMAHEFSHILNGDMRLNIRLIGVLHGILVLAIIGYYCFRFGGLSGSGGNRRGNNGAPIFLIGLAAMIIGYIGLFFGRLIKASVSRQREYLADASAVQFTRNPDGIAGALKKIGGLAVGSRMQSPEAETASHMFFGSAFQNWMFAPLSTHPPLADRVKRIEPAFSGEFPPTVPVVAAEPAKEKKSPQARDKGFGFGRTMRIPGLDQSIPLDPLLVMASIGAPDERAIHYSQNLLASMPNEVNDAVHDLFGARTVVFAMLLDDADDEIRNRQIRLLEQEGEETVKLTLRLADPVRDLGAEARLPIIELVQSTLVGLSDRQYKRFRQVVEQLIDADRKITLFEFVVQRGLLRHLDRHFLKWTPPRIDYYAVKAVMDHAIPVISILAHAGHRTAQQAEQAFQVAMEPLGAESNNAQLLEFKLCTPERLDEALDHLSRCSPQVKQRILQSAVICVAADQKVTVEEAELLRAVAVTLDIPVPPLVAGMPLDAQAGAVSDSNPSPIDK